MRNTLGQYIFLLSGLRVNEKRIFSNLISRIQLSVTNLHVKFSKFTVKLLVGGFFYVLWK